jgi:hypothetical protein
MACTIATDRSLVKPIDSDAAEKSVDDIRKQTRRKQ